MIKIGKYTWNPLILIKNLVILVCLVIIAWFTISYCEVLIKNVNPNPQYNTWNFFQVAERCGNR